MSAATPRLAFPVLGRPGRTATVYVIAGSLDGGPPPWVAAVRALVLGARGSELTVPGLPPIALGPTGQRGPAARTLTRALVPLGSGERTERLAPAAPAAGGDPPPAPGRRLPRRAPGARAPPPRGARRAPPPTP